MTLTQASSSRRKDPRLGSPGPFRRGVDVLVSVVVLVALSPLLATLWLLVVLTSDGPGFFRQERVGQGGRPFTLVKFRSMRSGPPGPEVTTLGDQRITGVGRLVRGSGLDELPQLWNILRGDMTLVGPRPETPSLAARYPAECRLIFAYRPGLTGPGQIYARDRDVVGADANEDYYATTVVPRRVALDLEYLRRPGFRATTRVLVDTVRHIIGRPAGG